MDLNILCGQERGRGGRGMMGESRGGGDNGLWMGAGGLLAGGHF